MLRLTCVETESEFLIPKTSVLYIDAIEVEEDDEVSERSLVTTTEGEEIEVFETLDEIWEQG